MATLSSAVYKQWLEMQPLSVVDENRLERKFMLDFNYNSNHIEGNTLTYGQTEVLLLSGEVVGNAKMKDLEEMKAHNVCLKMMRAEAATDNPLTENFIRQLHHTMVHQQTIIGWLVRVQGQAPLIHGPAKKVQDIFRHTRTFIIEVR